LPLHPMIGEAILAMRGAPAPETLDVAEARRLAKAGFQTGLADTPAAREWQEDVRTQEAVVPVRLYVPTGEGPHPVLVWFHGGGFCCLDAEAHDPICRAISAAAGCLVVSADYRLAPEHPFPAAVDDCFAVARWVAAHAARLGCDARRIVVGGDSAGGALAAVTALRARDEGGPAFAGQLLVYPVTDHPSGGWASYRECASGYGLTRGGMEWFWRQYLRDEGEAAHPWASPLRAASLEGLPPSLVLTAEYDVLRDEGEAYAGRLRAAGVAARLMRCEGLNHGFLRWAGRIDPATHAFATVTQWLAGRFGTEEPPWPAEP